MGFLPLGAQIPHALFIGGGNHLGLIAVSQAQPPGVRRGDLYEVLRIEGQQPVIGNGAGLTARIIGL